MTPPILRLAPVYHRRLDDYNPVNNSAGKRQDRGFENVIDHSVVEP